MKERYKIIYQGGEGEIVEKKSRFIAEIRPVESEEEGDGIYCGSQEEILGCETSLFGIYDRRK